MSSRESISSSGGDREGSVNADDQPTNGGGGIEEEMNSNDEEPNLIVDEYFGGEFEKTNQIKRRQHRKALDIKNNGLSTDGLQIMLDRSLFRYDTNVRFIELIQTGQTPDRLLVAEMHGQTASQIYTRCSKRDSFTETHVGDDIMATFSTIRDYRAACDMQRMDSERFQQVFDQFAAWDENQYEEFKRNYTLEYVFRRILQRDSHYRAQYTNFLKQCQESADYSTIERPLLPLPTPKFLTGDSQLELCNSSLRSKLRNMRRRETQGAGLDESSPESEAFLARLDEAVNSFFRRLDFVDESKWPYLSSISNGQSGIKKDPITDLNPKKKEMNGGASRKRAGSSLLSLPSLVGGAGKRMKHSMINPRSATQVSTLARAFLRKAFRGPTRMPIKAVSAKQNINESSPLFPDEMYADHLNGTDADVDAETDADVKMEPMAVIENHQRRPSLLASKRPSSYITKPGSSSSGSRMSINNISMMMMLNKAKTDRKLENRFPKMIIDPGLLDDDTPSSTNGYFKDDEESPPEQPFSLFGVGADEPIDEEDLRSILADLAGVHAVVNCDDFGRVIEHGSVQHPKWGTILVRRGRVVRLGSAQTGFCAPEPNMEFHFPMEELINFVPADKIRFDDERNLYLNGMLTDFYFLQP